MGNIVQNPWLTQSEILHNIGNAKYDLNDVAIALHEQGETEFYSEVNNIIDQINNFYNRYIRREEPVKSSRRPVKSSRKPIKSAIDYDDIDLAYAVGEAIPMASPSTQDAVTDWLLMAVDPEDEQFETEEDVTAFVENWIDHFANDSEYGADEDSIRDLVSCGYLDDSWLEDFEED